ncbi:MAG: L,D-transpeptidase family protein, partial [Thermomicrobiales bacterium]
GGVWDMGSARTIGHSGPSHRRTTFEVATWLGRIVAVAAVAALLLAGSLLANTKSVSAGDAATIVNEGSSLFAGVNDQSLIATMYAGERVDVLWGPENGLYEVRYYGIDGWTWAANLDIDGGNSAAWSASSAGGYSATVNAGSLSVRVDASFDAGILGYLTYGTGVDIIGDPANGFAPISYGGGVGWVYVDYLNWDGAVNYSGGGIGGVTSAIPEASVSAEHWVDVNRSNGAVTLFIGDEAQATYWGSLSYDTSDGGFYTTASGTYYVFSMYEPLAYTPYAKAYITDWVGFDSGRDNGFHSWTRDANGNVLSNGGGYTAGCVGLEPWAAQAVYNFSSIGMMVVVHD